MSAPGTAWLVFGHFQQIHIRTGLPVYLLNIIQCRPLITKILFVVDPFPIIGNSSHHCSLWPLVSLLPGYLFFLVPFFLLCSLLFSCNESSNQKKNLEKKADGSTKIPTGRGSLQSTYQTLLAILGSLVAIFGFAGSALFEGMSECLWR